MRFEYAPGAVCGLLKNTLTESREGAKYSLYDGKFMTVASYKSSLCVFAFLRFNKFNSLCRPEASATNRQFLSLARCDAVCRLKENCCFFRTPGFPI